MDEKVVLSHQVELQFQKNGILVDPESTDPLGDAVGNGMCFSVPGSRAKLNNSTCR